MGSFRDSPDISEAFDRIGDLEAQMGSATPDAWYEDIPALRAETVHVNGDLAGVLVVAAGYNNSVYEYDASSSEADNGITVIKPNDVSEDGRWILQVSFALANHNHSEKVEISGSVPPGNFITINADGKIANTTFNGSSFVEVVAGKGLSANDYTDAEKAKLAGLPADIDVDDKMDKITPTTGNLNNLVAIDDQGNAKDSERNLTGVWQEFSFQFGGTVYPTTYNLDTITIGTYRLAIVHYILGLPADRSRARAGTFFVFLDGTNPPVLKEGEAFVTGTDFDGDISASANSGLLRFSYTQEEGAENAEYLGIQILLK
ncbi:hypothetical protein ES708_18022 [subsurface metagenome]